MICSSLCSNKRFGRILSTKIFPCCVTGVGGLAIVKLTVQRYPLTSTQNHIMSLLHVVTKGPKIMTRSTLPGKLCKLDELGYVGLTPSHSSMASCPSVKPHLHLLHVSLPFLFNPMCYAPLKFTR